MIHPFVAYVSSSFFFSIFVGVSVQFNSVAQSCPTLCDPMNRSTPGLPVHHQLPEFTQTHIHRVSDAIQPSHPLSSPSPRAPNPSQHQSLQWVNSLHEVAKILEFLIADLKCCVSFCCIVEWIGYTYTNIHSVKFFYFIFKVFGCTGSWLQHAGSLVAAVVTCGI